MICRGNQWIAFYMMGTLAMKELIWKKASQTIYKSLSSKESYIVALFYSHIVRSSFPTSLKYTNAKTTLKRMTKFIQKIKNQLAFSQT